MEQCAYFNVQSVSYGLSILNETVLKNFLSYSFSQQKLKGTSHMEYPMYYLFFSHMFIYMYLLRNTSSTIFTHKLIHWTQTIGTFGTSSSIFGIRSIQTFASIVKTLKSIRAKTGVLLVWQWNTNVRTGIPEIMFRITIWIKLMSILSYMSYLEQALVPCRCMDENALTSIAFLAWTISDTPLPLSLSAICKCCKVQSVQNINFLWTAIPNGCLTEPVFSKTIL